MIIAARCVVRNQVVRVTLWAEDAFVLAGPGRFGDRSWYESVCHCQVVGRLVSPSFFFRWYSWESDLNVCRWTGQVEGQEREGLFPASYVKLL